MLVRALSISCSLVPVRSPRYSVIVSCLLARLSSAGFAFVVMLGSVLGRALRSKLRSVRLLGTPEFQLPGVATIPPQPPQMRGPKGRTATLPRNNHRDLAISAWSNLRRQCSHN